MERRNNDIMAEKQTIVVTGATGLQGVAVTRHLLASGWHVRALTRNPKSKQAQALSTALCFCRHRD
jgi:uncharacterized protein YbjT (DUF2867 family)